MARLSSYTIQIDEDAITEQINNILNHILNREIHSRYSQTGDVVSTAVKELVYSNKDEIIDKVVDRAVKEITRKALPKLLDRMGGAEDGK